MLSRSIVLVLGLGLVSSLGLATAAAAKVRIDLGDGLVATLDPGQDLLLEATPRRGEGMLGFARRLCGSSRVAGKVAELNGSPRHLIEGVRYRVPFALLLPEYRVRIARALFDQDEALGEGWRHRARLDPDGSGSESLWSIALWFTGRGENYVAIRQANGGGEDEVAAGEQILIPARLLRPTFRALLPETSPYYLTYGRDEEGEYAEYRLKRGEALYSSVVVRFNGAVFAQDVNELAREIAARSGIDDVTDIPVDYEVKIPFELLLPEFLPAGHPQRLEYEEGLIASAQYRNAVRTRGLEGVTVVLDAGHGGTDVGATVDGVWESVYVYDIVARVQRLLEQRTAAKVYTTTRDGDRYTVLDRDVLPTSRGHRVLTTPEYAIEDSRVALNLRWYLSNSIHRRALSNGGDNQKTVFLSIHADSLHSSLRGAMAYIPGAKWRRSSFAKSGPVYAARKEVREAPRVSFSKQELARSEGLSRDLAHHLIDAFEGSGLEVHDDKPVRDKIIRRRRTWVPAVLRYNRVPAAVLFEVCNLNNAQDRKLIQTADFRQRVSEALVRGLLDYYGSPDLDGTDARTARR